MDSDEQARALDASFRQSRKEMWVILAAWGVFLLWTGIGSAVLSASSTKPSLIPLIAGIPKWVAFGVVIPWVCALGFIIWFTTCFMKDTSLESDQDGETENSSTDD